MKRNSVGCISDPPLYLHELCRRAQGFVAKPHILVVLTLILSLPISVLAFQTEQGIAGSSSLILIVGTTVLLVLIGSGLWLRTRRRSQKKEDDQTVGEFSGKYSENRNRAFLEAIPDLMFLQTRDGIYTDYHAKNDKDLLVPPEEFLGKSMFEVLPADLAQRFSDSFDRAVDGEPQILEYMLTLDEVERCFEARVVSRGKEILTVIRDVTSRKFTEEALKRNEAQLAGIIESAMDGIVTIDEEQHIVLFNDAAEKIFGCSSAEAMGQPLSRFIPERFHNLLSEDTSLASNGGPPRLDPRGELCGVRASGEEFPLEASVSHIEVNEQELLTIILRDITERKRAEAEVKASEANYRAVFNAASDAILIHDLKTGAVLDVNERMCEMYGYTFEEAKRLHFEALGCDQGPFTQQSGAKWFERAAEGEPQLFEWLAKDKAGHLFWVEVSLKRAHLGGRNVLLAVVRDITERKRVMDELRQSEARFAKAFRANPQPMSITTLNGGVYLDINQSFLAMSGYSREEVLGQTAFDLGVWGTTSARANFIKELTDKGSVMNIETSFKTKDGTLRVLLSSAEQMELGGEQCLLVASSDITDRKEAEVALRRAHEELQGLKNQLEAENIYLQEELQLDQTFSEIVGHSDAIKYVVSKISQVAPTDSTVLVMGETGTGKELVARAIHSASLQKERPLIKVNCAALSPTLIESELFGHEKGAFTGAGTRKLGRFELADGGTIFLDEIGELPVQLQSKLLRVLQEGEFERVGGSRTIKVSVRIIAATNRNLKAEVDKGTFREDLWYRLNVFPITVPPLRQRKEDIPLLVEHFVTRFAKRLGKTIKAVSPRSMQALQAHSWPGNVREMANVLERAVINSHGPVLHLVDTFDQLSEQHASALSLDEIEREYILRTLENTGWRVEGPFGAAKILGLNASTLRARMSKLGIHRPRSRAV